MLTFASIFEKPYPECKITFSEIELKNYTKAINKPLYLSFHGNIVDGETLSKVTYFK